MSILNYETVVVNVTPTPSQLYRLGWNHYVNGVRFETLATMEEKRGYLSANAAEASALTGYDNEVWR